MLGLPLLLVVGTALSGCATSLKMSPMDPKGPVAAEQYQLLSMTMWYALAIGIVVTLLLVGIVWFYRDRGDTKTNPEQIHGSTKLEIAWTLIPILILVSVAVPTVKTAFSTYQPKEADAMTVKVIGHQWWFEFQYADGTVITANEMHIPVGKPVKLDLTSDDVIHSFWVPKLAGKTDMIPNRINHMWLQASEVGDYFGQCAEFCATSHANMKFHVIAQSQADYDKWFADLKAGAKTPTDAAALAGKALFEGAKDKTKANCITCHAISGTPANGKVGPNLTNVGGRQTIAAGLLANTEENLRKWIRSPQSVKPGAKMVAHPNMTDEELGQVIAYLKSLK
jgi:cytochrome c oxidase subunit 2